MGRSRRSLGRDSLAEGRAIITTAGCRRAHPLTLMCGGVIKRHLEQPCAKGARGRDVSARSVAENLCMQGIEKGVHIFQSTTSPSLLLASRRGVADAEHESPSKGASSSSWLWACNKGTANGCLALAAMPQHWQVIHIKTCLEPSMGLP